MLYGIGLFDVILATLTLTSLISVLFNKSISRKAKLKTQHIKLIIGSSLLLLIPLMAIEVGIIPFFINFSLMTFCIFIFITGFLVDRKYVYISAILFLVIATVTNTIGLENFAEYMAVLCYLLLVLGVTKDIFYEKVFKTN